MPEEIKSEINNEGAGWPHNPGRSYVRKMIVLLFLALSIGAGAAYYTSRPKPSVPAPDTSVAPADEGGYATAGEDALPKEGSVPFVFSLVKPVFALSDDAGTAAVIPSLPAYKPTADELKNLDDFKREFSESELEALSAAGFFLSDEDMVGEQRSGNDDFADIYEAFSGSSNKYYRQADNALFITSDVALHLYHILVDRSFQKIEEIKFQPMLKEITRALFEDSLRNYETASDPALKDSYGRLAVFYLVPLVVLDAADRGRTELKPEDFDTYAQFLAAKEARDEEISRAGLDFSLDEPRYNGRELGGDIFSPAQAELELIREAKGLAPSPLFTPYRPYLQNDYSQFKPRSHYTKNDALKSYFIAMMWYGRMGFSLDSPELTRDAIMITGQVNSLKAGGRAVAEIYADMAGAIEFFVGQVDDLTPYEYTGLIREVYGETVAAERLADDSALRAFIGAAIEKLPRPRIVSEAVDLYDNGGERDALLRQLMQFRFMGQRFTPDAYILNQLTQGVGAPDPETGQNLPSMTTALMPVNIIAPGNATVGKYVDVWVAAEASASDRIIAKKTRELREEFAAFDEAVWTQNIYWSWLDSYRSLLSGYGPGYPYFMTTGEWQKKNLGTVLGSYAELKHDTLLYAKQSYAERGGGGDNPSKLPPVPKGYVEADPAFWSRIKALARMTDNGLTERGLMPEYFGVRYKTFADICGFFAGLAEKELKDEVISEEDFEKLRVSGFIFEDLAAPLPGEELSDKERRAGIIADIHTDAVSGRILYEATGKPYIIYAAVEDANGARLTRGAVFNHYELTGPLTERYADEDWQERVYDGKGDLPAADAWSRELMK